MADDWRVTVTLSHAARASRMAQAIRKRWAQDGAGLLGYRVAVSADGPRLFLYAATEGAAREVDRVVRETLAQHQSHAELALDRWHPLAQELGGRQRPAAGTRRCKGHGAPAPDGV